jgi:1-acyl-sn-glycerol-3-phosphate acyltransferase
MIRNLFCVLVAIVWTMVCFPLAALAIIVTFNASNSMYVVQRLWSPVLLWAGGAKLVVDGLENIPRGTPHIYVSNHQSTIDIPTLFMALGVDFRFAAKKSLKYVPMLGWYMSLAKFPFIDRSNHRDAVASLDKGGAQIRSGVNIVMFPEGTRSDDQRVLPFKKGPFALATKAGVGVVPVTIEGSGRLMPKNSWNITPGVIHVRVGKPIDPAPFNENREALMVAVRDVIIEQSLAMGGKGGDKQNAVAAKGLEGIGRGPEAIT